MSVRTADSREAVWKEEVLQTGEVVEEEEEGHAQTLTAVGQTGANINVLPFTGGAIRG